MKLIQNVRSSAAAASTFGGTTLGVGAHAGGTAGVGPGPAHRIKKLVVAQNSSAASTVWAAIRYGQSSGNFSTLSLVPCGSSFQVDSFDVDLAANSWDWISGSSEIAIQV